MLPMALEDPQAGRQQVLELGVAGGGNQRGLKGGVDLLVESDFVLRISFIEGGALEASQLFQLRLQCDFMIRVRRERSQGLLRRWE